MLWNVFCRPRVHVRQSAATLGGLADALGVDFGRLIRSDESRASRIVRIADAAVLWSDDLGSEARHVLISREPQSVELLQWVLKPGASYEAKPDPDGTDILLVISRGTLTLTAEDQVSHLTAATAGHIISGSGYALANTGQEDAAFTLVQVPPAGRARYTRAAAKPAGNALASGMDFDRLTVALPVRRVCGGRTQGRPVPRAPVSDKRRALPGDR